MDNQTSSNIERGFANRTASCFSRMLAPNYTVLPLMALVIFGTAGNSLVCLSIIFERKLQSATNYFLFSLAVADLMVSLFVMPASIIVELHQGLWLHGYKLCLVYASLDVVLCSTSIVHMAVISLDRYRGISRPFRARNKTTGEVAQKIVMIWLATAVLSSPICIIAFVKPETIWMDCQCGIFPNFKLAPFQIYGTITTFLLPSCIMVVTYVKTVRLLRAQMQLTLGKDPVLRRNAGSSVPLQTTYMLEKAEILRRQEQGHDELSPPGIANVQAINKIFSAVTNKRKKQNPITRKMGVGKPSMKKNMRKAATAYYLMCRKDSRALVKREKKATTVLGVVFGSFFLCWSPFFITNLVLAVCGKMCRQFPSVLAGIFIWLGYASSTINPLIFTAFNSVYRVTFVNILRCRCLHASHYRRSVRSSNRSANHYPLKDRKQNSTFISTKVRAEAEKTEMPNQDSESNQML